MWYNTNRLFTLRRGIYMKANYHTHTPRCHHATGTEREYIEAAIDNGIQVLGFSDHTPYLFNDEHSQHIRMRMNELDGYISTVLDLKKEYQRDIDIHVGLEVEYFPKYFDEIYEKLKQYPLEYFLLAGHWYGNSHKTDPYFGLYTENPEILKNYHEQMTEGIKRGCFTYVAHPDLINYPSNTQLYEETMRDICRVANEYALPLEINLRGVRTHKQYPNPDFWKIAGEENCKVVIGIDAHGIDELDYAEAYQKAMTYVERYQLRLLEDVALKTPF